SAWVALLQRRPGVVTGAASPPPIAASIGGRGPGARLRGTRYRRSPSATRHPRAQAPRAATLGRGPTRGCPDRRMCSVVTVALLEAHEASRPHGGGRRAEDRAR